MSSLPLGGLILFITLDICKIHTSKCKTISPSYEIPDASKYASLSSMRTNIQEEVNIVPIQDALIFNDNKTKRALITKVLLDDPYNYLKVLTKALGNTDTETSHYAATAISEIKRSLAMIISKLEIEYRDSADNVDVKKSYAQALIKYTESGLLDKRVYTKYLNILLSVLSEIAEVGMDDEYFLEQKIRCEINLEKYDNALNSCKEYMRKFNKSDIPYTLLMKIYFITKDRKNFRNTLKIIQDANVDLKRQSSKVVKFWS
jgi:hypothetical protein